jgi:GxxExxY protein
MPSPAPNGTLPPRESSLILSQRDREIGRSSWFKRSQNPFHATETLGDRLGDVTDVDFRLSERVIAACIEVHRVLGPGLLEGIYEECLCHELTLRNLGYERQKAISVEYKGTAVDQGYRMDLIIEGSLLVEVKAVEALLPVHAAQVVTYLRVARLDSGLLVNFNAMTIRDGLHRLWRNPKISRSPDLFVKKSGPS